MTDPRLSDRENALCRDAADWPALVAAYAQAFTVSPGLAAMMAQVAVFGDDLPDPEAPPPVWAAKFGPSYDAATESELPGGA